MVCLRLLYLSNSILYCFFFPDIIKNLLSEIRTQYIYSSHSIWFRFTIERGRGGERGGGEEEKRGRGGVADLVQ